MIPGLFAALADRRGVSGAEYAVLAVAIVLVVAVAAVTLGASIAGAFDRAIN